MPHPAPRLYVISDRRLAGGIAGMLDSLCRIAAVLAPGTLAVQVREKDLAPRDIVALARSMVGCLAPWGVPVLVNDRFDLAKASGAAGVHLSSSGLDPVEVRKAYGGIVSVSTHSAAELSRLHPANVDFAVFGPIFDTPSKRPHGPPLGVEALCHAVRVSGVPVVALGGIRLGNVGLLSGSGAAGIATISAVLAAPDPAEAACRMADAAVAARSH